MTDKEPGSPTSPKSQSITFKTEVNLTPLTKNRLQKALTVENAWASQKDSISDKASWVDRYVERLHEAFAKGSKAESSTCGFSESSDRCSAREGTTQDLRYTLTQIWEKYGPLVMMYRGHDALGRHWVSGWKVDGPYQLVVVMCVEEEDAKEKSFGSAQSFSTGKQAENDAEWTVVEDESEEWFGGFEL